MLVNLNMGASIGGSSGLASADAMRNLDADSGAFGLPLSFSAIRRFNMV